MYRPNGQEYFDTVKTGEVALTSVATQLPDISCLLVKFKAKSANGTNIYLGGGSTATIPDLATDATTGLELAASADTDFIPVTNLNKFFRLVSGGNVGGLT